MYFALQDELMRRAAGDLMPTRLFYDFLKTSLETNARIAENLSAFMKSQQGALMKEADSAPRDKSASGGAFFTPFADFNQKDRWVYTFGAGKADGSAQMREVLGGKGANLAEMSNLGLPVPPGFTISTEVCALYNERGRSFPDSLTAEVDEAIAAIGRQVGAAFGDPQNPLLVSVRSGARASMPGMMDTVLNLGLNDETARGLAAQSGDDRFAYDSYRRFIQMYSDVVLGIDHHIFEEILDTYKHSLGLQLDTDLTAEDWRGILEEYKEAVERETGQPFPQDVKEQLWGAIAAVFDSWKTPRAVTYRKLHAIPEHWGTAVNVQAMVFGNRGETSATGVAFTRNPSTGEKEIYGEFLLNAQGEDVVAGIRTPQNLTEQSRNASGDSKPSLEALMPDSFAELCEIFAKLERHYRDMQDVEFTIQEGKLWMLQTRSGKRTTKAALKIAVDMAAEGLITREEAVMRVDPMQLDQLLHPTLDPTSEKIVLATGLPASPGAATGEIVFDADKAESLKNQSRKVILVRTETSPEDIHGMHAAVGILTARGGMTSHAAVVARGMGRPCISGASAIRIDMKARTMTIGERVLMEGEIITIDGAKGEVIEGAIATIQPELSGDFAQLMQWADAIRRMNVRANAETPADVRQAREFGAEGIGLCRTEHMFFDEERVLAMREMILASDETGRRAALAKLLPMQRQDFVEIFEIMSGLPVTIRLLDPPLHEFLPAGDDEIAEVANSLGYDVSRITHRLALLREFNPMLGHRGCRLAITYPEITEMQARAIFEAAIEAGWKTGQPVSAEIMVPLVGVRKEFDLLKAVIDRIAEDIFRESGTTISYQVGTMIELPRAALRAGEIAETAEFFSFGTNDLTQTTFGISRDDAGSFLSEYTARGILETDPFVSLDRDGVGELVKIGAERGRAARATLKLGICGEHGGDPRSIDFCETIGLDYVSCSPYRVPIARLAAAQATLLARS
jgi:pyruvate,orthophosphate dikinase